MKFRNKFEFKATRFVARAFVVVLLLAFAATTELPSSDPNAPTVEAYAKSKKEKKNQAKANENPKISKTAVNVRKKKSFSLKVTGTKRKVKWSTSDKSLVKLKKNGKMKVKVKAKKKDGACVVRAIVGGKVLYCLVVVNGSTNMSAQSKAWAKAAGFDELLGKTNPEATPLKVGRLPEITYARLWKSATMETTASGDGLRFKWYEFKNGTWKVNT
jgi:hypothetical protein